MPRAVCIVPKTHAELNQCVSLLRSTNFRCSSSGQNGKVGARVTVWLNTGAYSLNTKPTFPHERVTPNQLAELLQEL